MTFLAKEKEEKEAQYRRDKAEQVKAWNEARQSCFSYQL
jgi:hypothetical protein